MRRLVVFLLVVAGAFPQPLDLLLLHNNDMHGRFEETSRNSGTCKPAQRKGCVGGFARTAHEIRWHRKAAAEGRGSPVLYLNAGDTFVGTAWFTVHKWRICAEFLNALRPDAMSLGNHEFDYGVKELAPLVANVTFPIVAANLNFTQEPSLSAIKKSVVVDVAGRKVGIVGYLTPDTKLMSSPGNVAFLDEVESLRKESELLDRAGVKIIIALGHSGYDMDKRIARDVPLVDVVIGGHTNTFLWNGPPPDSEVPEDLYPKVVEQPGGKKVPVVQAYAYTKYLGILNVTFDESGDLVRFVGQPEFLDSEIPQDQDVVEMLEKYRPKIQELDKLVVGNSKVVLDATDNKCRKKECNFGNLIADAFVYYMASLNTGPGWTDVPIALINGGSIRTTIDPSSNGGNVTRGELLGTLPFDNQVVALKLTGADIVRSLEIGARSNGETSSGEFLQVSGLHVVYNMSQPSFSRVVSVKARCGDCKVPVYEPIVLDKVYDVVSVTFLVNGGDDHQPIRDGKDKRTQDLGDVDMVEWYLKRVSPVYPEEQGRISFVEAPQEKPVYSKGSRRLLSPVVSVVIVAAHQFFNFFEIR